MATKKKSKKTRADKRVKTDKPRSRQRGTGPKCTCGGDMFVYNSPAYPAFLNVQYWKCSKCGERDKTVKEKA